MVNKVIQLKCSCNEYQWGKQGRESLAATLCEKTPGTDFKLDESKTYAEM
jgi:mannose-6-phosphate isomerase